MEDMWTLMLPNTELVSTTINTTKKSRLLTLPGEIRNNIWRMLLTTRYAFKEPTSKDDCEAHYELQPAILRANRQIYEETHGILRYENMWIFLCIAMQEKPIHYFDETARLPVVSRRTLTEPKEAMKCYMGKNSNALNMFLYPEHKFQMPYHDYDFHTMIMGPESLPCLLQMLFAMLYQKRSVRSISTPPRRSLEMYVGYPTCFTRSRLQKEILDPFSTARGLRILSIDGNVDEIFASSLMAEMRRSWASGTELLELCQAYLQKGDAAAAGGTTKAASLHFENGSDFTFFAGMSYLNMFHPRAETEYIYLRICSMLDVFDIRWAKVLLKLRCYADVRRVTVSILSRQRQPHTTSIDEKVELVLCCAFASLALGQIGRFSQIMRGLVQGTCDLCDLTTDFGWTNDTRPIFSDKRSLIRRKEATIKEFDDLVAYCKQGEESSLRRMDTGGCFADREDIELPVAQDWSVIAARYESRRERRALYEPIDTWI